MLRLPLLGAAGLLLLPACVSFNLNQHRLFQEPPPAQVAALAPGDALAEALDRLGAPAEVAEDGDGAILTWTWDEGDGQGFNVSVPVARGQSLSFNWRDSETLAHRLRLRFDAEWRLVQVIEEGKGEGRDGERE